MSSSESIVPLYLYHTNDLHSNLKQWPAAVSFLKARQTFHHRKQETSFFFDIGDHADLANPITEASRGKGNVELLNEAGVQYATIGNNEGITLSKEELNTLYENAEFNVLLANLFEEDGSRPGWASPFTIVNTEEGVRVGLIGLTVPFYPFYTELGWDIRDPFQVLSEVLRTVRPQADIVILLSHLGYPQDEEVARRFPGVDVILGAHTHHLLKSSVIVHDTLIAQCGRGSYYVGAVQLLYDKKTNQIIKKDGAAVDVSIEEPSYRTQQLVEQLQMQADYCLAEEIACMPEEVPISWDSPSLFADLLTEGVREWCQADIAMLNSGLLLESLPAGPVTKGDVHRICPHPINPCLVEVKGSILKETIASSFTEKMINLPLRGLGFRGEKLGRMAFAGAEIVMADGGSKTVRQIVINGEPIKAEETYKLATADMFTFGSLYPGLAQSGPKKYFMPETIRDVLMFILQKKYPS
ncbi:bifunctional metallophosphatase/5'-nucleotidase [Bacillus piscicola]|uniref:bifunctional metallophosphatase/5'-nucleotidase n=1 Tax=Bacillus piscicola TaxID=1632684 RepID=UPI001F095836|nr:bifunctional UDP-sugar hydrolase/5'-nucleotidase [Bacillus piscicola]